MRIFVLAAALFAASPGAAQILGPQTARCAPGGGPAMLVAVTGLRDRHGTVRVRIYGGDSRTWFEKGRWLTRIQVPVPATGPVRLCAPVAAPGTYAVEVRHDTNGDDKTDRADGGGASGNPRVSIFSFLFGRKPSPAITAVAVGRGTTEVPVTMMYLSGTAFRPIAETRR